VTQIGRRPPADEPSARPCRIILVGMMGSGKTTVGRLLATRTGWPYHDNDELLRARTGLTARELHHQQGEAGLRAAENAALHDGVSRPAPCILGTAAGTIISQTSRDVLPRAGLVVWLRARPETLAQRAAGGWHRPWLELDPVAWLAARSAERDALYGQAADLVVNVDTKLPAAVATAILSVARTAAACPP